MCICLDQSLTLASADDLKRRTGVLQFPSSSSKTTRTLGTVTVNVCLDLPSGKDGWPHSRFSETNKIHYYISSINSNIIKQFWAQWKAKDLLHKSNTTFSNSFSCSHIYDMIYLLTAIGLTPGVSSTVHIYTQTIHRMTQNKQYIEQHKNFGRVRAVPRLCGLYPDICLTTEEKAQKNNKYST